jgi:pimeloyl-ACP methyl ester carboxylesterase
VTTASKSPRSGVAAVLLALVIAAASANAEPPESGTVASADGVAIAYERHGTGGSALVLVHGWSCDRSYWQAQAAALADRFTVVTLDLAGHGESGSGRSDWTIASFGADVAAVAGRLALTDIVLVGHGMGGDVILEAQRLLPGRVRGLVWVDTYKQLPIGRTTEQLDAFIASLEDDYASTTQNVVRRLFDAGSDPGLVDRVARDMASAPPAIGIPTVRSALLYACEVPDVLQAIDVPVVAINPEQPASNAAALQRHGVDLVTLPGGGHFLMMEAPERFNAALADVVHRFLHEQGRKAR